MNSLLEPRDDAQIATERVYSQRTDLSRCVTEEDLLLGYAVVVAATEAA